MKIFKLEELGNIDALKDAKIEEINKRKVGSVTVKDAPDIPEHPGDGFIDRISRTYLYTKKDKENDIPWLAKKTGLSPDAIRSLKGDDYEKVVSMANARDRGEQMKTLIEKNPNLENIELKDANEQAQIIHNASELHETVDILGSFSEGWERQKLSDRRAYIGSELSRSDVTEERRNELEKELKEIESELMKFGEKHGFLNSAAQGIAGMGYDMWHDIDRNKELLVMSTGANALAGAGMGLAAGGVGAIPSAIINGGRALSYTYWTVQAKEVYTRSQGLKYLELRERKDSDGNYIYTHEEAQTRSVAHGLVDAGIEVAANKLSFGMAKKFLPKVARTSGDAMQATIGSIFGHSAKQGIKVAAVETGEEIAQSLNDDLQTNLFGKKGDVKYSFSDITDHAIETAKEVAPTTIALGGIGSVFNMSGGMVRRAQFNRLDPETKKVLINQSINDKASEVLDGIVEDSKKNTIAKHAPELYGKIVKNAAEGQNLTTAFINAHEAVKTKYGTHALEELIDKGVLKADEVSYSIESQAPIQMPFDKFAENANGLSKDTFETLKQITQYGEDGMSNYAIEQKKIEAQYAQNGIDESKLTENLAKKDDFIGKHMPELNDEERLIARDAIGLDKDLAVATIEKQKALFIGDVWDNLAVGRLLYDASWELEERGISVSDIRLYEHVLENERARVTEELQTHGIEGVTADVMSNVEQLSVAVDQLRAYDNVIQSIQKVSDKEYARYSLSDEATEVYDRAKRILNKGNVKVVKENADAYAMILANRAEVYAKAMRAMGNANYKVSDYLKKIHIEIGGTYETKAPKQRKQKGKKHNWQKKVAEPPKRGLMTRFDDGTYFINLFKDADASTFIHEMGHVFLEDLKNLAKEETATERIKNDWATVKELIGYDENGTQESKTEATEYFARSFEGYVREGKSPNKVMQGVFQKFRTFLCNIYKSIVELGVEPNHKLHEVMGRMVATTESINEWAEERKLNAFEYSELLELVPEEERTNLKQMLDDMKDSIADEVRERFADEYNGNMDALWEQKKGKVQEQIEQALMEQYPCYKARVLYDKLGEGIFAFSEYKTETELKEAEERALGPYRRAVYVEMKAAREAFMETEISREEVFKIADEWFDTTEAQEAYLEAEAQALRHVMDSLLSENLRRLTFLRNLDLESETFEDDLQDVELMAIDKLKLKMEKAVQNEKYKGEVKVEKEKQKQEELKEKHKEKTQAQREKTNERIENLKEKHKQKIDEVRAKLEERMAIARMLRDTKFGKLKDRLTTGYAQLRNVSMRHAMQYWSHERRLKKDREMSAKAAVRGDAEAAFKYKQDSFDAIARMRISKDLANLFRRKVRRWKSLNKMLKRRTNPKKVNPHARFFIQRIMHNLGVISNDGIEPIGGFSEQELMKFLYPEDVIEGGGRVTKEENGVESTEYEEGTTDKELHPTLRRLLENEIDVRDLTVEEFQMVSHMIEFVYARGRHEYRSYHLLDKHGKLVSYDIAAKEIVEGSPLTQDMRHPITKRNTRSTVGKLAHKIGGAVLNLIRADVILERIDGNKKGAAYNYIYETISRASSKALEAQVQVGAELKEIFSIYNPSKLHKIRTERKYTIGRVENCTKEQLLCMALNLGTKDNRQRLEETLHMPIEQIEEKLNKELDGDDIKFIEAVWDMYDSWFEQRSMVEERMNGLPMQKVAGYTFNLGEREIHGKYYPIVYDYDVDVKAPIGEKEAELQRQISATQSFNSGMGATHTRQTNVKGRLLMLDFKVITTTMNDAIRHVHLREPLIEAYSVLNRNIVEEHIVNTLGKEQFMYLQEWVRDVWAAERQKTSVLEMWLKKAKRTSVFASLAFRTQTAVLNATNIFPVIHYLGAGDTYHALRSFYTMKYRQNEKFVYDKSVMMRNRNLTLDSDLKMATLLHGDGFTYSTKVGEVASKTAHKVTEARDKINEFAYYAIAKTDLALALPVWKQVYENKARELRMEGVEDNDIIESLSVSAADSAVKDVFGSASKKDTVGLQRGSWVAHFTPFYTYSSTMFNYMAKGFYKGKDTGNWLPLATSVFATVMMPAIMEYALREFIKGISGEERDEPEEMAKGVLSRIVGNTVQGLPIFRDVVDLYTNVALGEPTYGRTMPSTPAWSVIEKGYKLAQTLNKDEVSAVEVGRQTSQVVNRVIGFSDTLSDGFWGLISLLSEDTEKTVWETIFSLAFDKRVQKKQ